MDKENMPETDAAHYELAFHVLPTVAEGEVVDVFSTIKQLIEQAGGSVTSEEEPARFELAYEIIKHLEGRNRKFTSAYFGWVRFTIEPAKLAEVTEAVEGINQLLRHLLIRLNKLEEANPFMFHEALEPVEAPVETDAEVKEEGESSDDTPVEEEEKASA